jgi:hypothetical protein
MLCQEVKKIVPSKCKSEEKGNSTALLLRNIRKQLERENFQEISYLKKRRKNINENVN